MAKILIQDEIHRSLDIWACDIFGYESEFQRCLDSNQSFTKLTVNYANDVDILNAIFNSKMNKWQRLKLDYSLGLSSIENHFCQLVNINQTLVQLDLIDAADFSDSTV